MPSKRRAATSPRNIRTPWRASKGCYRDLRWCRSRPARLPLPLPAKEQPIWSAALGAGATHLLTGDLRDFGPHMNRRDASGGVLIQSVAHYLAGL